MTFGISVTRAVYGRIAAIHALAMLLTLTAWFGAYADDRYPEPKVKALSGDPPTRVLFVGNSYFYYNDSLHNHVKRIIAELQPELSEKLAFKSHTIGGARLSHHAIDHLLTPGRIGIEEPFELVIMQGGSAEVLSDRRREEFFATTKSYADKVRAIGGQPAFYMTHGYVPPHRRADPELIDAIAPAYILAGNDGDALVIPVGLAFDEAYRQRPNIGLHETFDGTHPNMNGTYLAACVVYLSVYRQPINHLTYTYFGEVDADVAAFLRGVATLVVSKFFAEREKISP